MDPIQSILVWVASNWFPLAVGSAVTCGIVKIQNIFAAKEK